MSTPTNLKHALPLPALLRNTALQAALLAQGASTTDVTQLRARCLALTNEFDAALEAQHVPTDVKQDALYMQCGLLDETVLSHLPELSRAPWEAHPLQVERFSQYDAGERVFDRLVVRMRETPLNVELLECYATVLGLGFKGRYLREGEPRRQDAIKALNDLLTREARGDRPGLVVDAARTHGFDWFHRLSPWALAGLGCLAAAIIFALIGQGLDVQMVHLLAAKS